MEAGGERVEELNWAWTTKLDWAYDKRNSPADLHWLIDVIYRFAERNDGIAQSRSISHPTWLVRWEADGWTRTVQVTVMEDQAIINVGAFASLDDLTMGKLFYTGRAKDRDLQFPSTPEHLERTLELSLGDAMSFTRDDLDRAVDLKRR